jgi:hypothetical protein
MMQTQLPEGLRALMQASQLLQQESMPVVQTPAGPKPTVAGAVSQGLQQIAESKAQPFMQTAGLEDLGRQAGLGAAIQSQQMARQQQMAQNPQAIAQLAAQMLQRRPEQEGIANIPVDMSFKDGGIIGYNGETGSQVEDIAAKAARELALIEQGALLGPSPEVESYLKNQAAPAPVIASELDPFVAAVSPAARVPQAPREYQGTPDVREGVENLYARLYPERIARPASKAPQEEPEVSRPELPAPTDASMLAKARALVPDDTQSRMQELLNLRGREERFREGMENLEQQGIMAIQSAGQQRRAAAQRTQEDDNLRRFLAAMKSIRTGGDDYVRTLDALDQRDALNRQAEQNEGLAILKYKEAEQNRKLGKFERERADILKGNEYSQKAREEFLKALQITTSADTSIFGTQSRSRDVALQVASSAADRAAQREAMADARKNTLIKEYDQMIVNARTNLQKLKEDSMITLMSQNTEEGRKMREQNADKWNRYQSTRAALEADINSIQQRKNALLGIDGFGQLTIQ